MQACPFGAPRYEWDRLAPRIHKCTLCPDRLEAGRPTACAEACPAEATVCGTLDELVAEARRRMRSAPGRYHDRIYGLEGLGGGSVLMISSRPLEDLGVYPRGAGNEPLPDLTWKVLKKIPSAVAVGGILLGGIWWITLRRMEIQDEALRATARGDAARGAPTREGGATNSSDARSAPSGR
jgi:formate dehydrogenase iron-sulfur subunit